MDIQQLLGIIKSSQRHRHLYHFTDESNIESIRRYGLLSKTQLMENGISPSMPSGNEWSWDADRLQGIFDYVSLSMTRNHPMLYALHRDERVKQPRFLYVEPEIILEDGVLFAHDVANRKDVRAVPLVEAISTIDVEVLYNRSDWNDPAVNQRLRAVERYEILIPKSVPVSRI